MTVGLLFSTKKNIHNTEQYAWGSKKGNIYIYIYIAIVIDTSHYLLVPNKSRVNSKERGSGGQALRPSYLSTWVGVMRGHNSIKGYNSSHANEVNHVICI